MNKLKYYFSGLEHLRHSQDVFYILILSCTFLFLMAFSSGSKSSETSMLEELGGSWHCQFDIESDEKFKFESEYSLSFDIENSLSFTETTMRMIDKNTGLRSSSHNSSKYKFTLNNGILMSTQLSSNTVAITDPFNTLDSGTLELFDLELKILKYSVEFSNSRSLILTKQDKQMNVISCLR